MSIECEKVDIVHGRHLQKDSPKGSESYCVYIRSIVLFLFKAMIFLAILSFTATMGWTTITTWFFFTMTTTLSHARTILHTAVIFTALAWSWTRSFPFITFTSTSTSWMKRIHTWMIVTILCLITSFLSIHKDMLPITIAATVTFISIHHTSSSFDNENYLISIHYMQYNKMFIGVLQ